MIIDKKRRYVDGRLSENRIKNSIEEKLDRNQLFINE
jgi:hypothetical protein